MLFFSIFFFLLSSQYVQAKKCSRIDEADINSRLSVSFPNLRVYSLSRDGIRDGMCSQGCIIFNGIGQRAVEDPVERFSYRFDDAGSWTALTKGTLKQWWLERRAAPTDCMSNWNDDNYQTFIYDFDFDVSIAALSPGTHKINLKYTYDIYDPTAEYQIWDSFVVPVPPTLSVNLTAYPSSGTAPLYDVDLDADVSGTATGNIIYQFDCTNNGTWE
ncbi:MAG: hypothetical protein L6257_03060, partial [Candidatus Portnoybacteria bacterium]|nr:hypothetical protein [Candidatus Portnoybacteria bacterium]